MFGEILFIVILSGTASSQSPSPTLAPLRQGASLPSPGTGCNLTDLAATPDFAKVDSTMYILAGGHSACNWVAVNVAALGASGMSVVCCSQQPALEVLAPGNLRHTRG